MQNMRPFQIGLLAAFGIIGLASLALLATFQGFGGLTQNPYGSKVVIWGTFPEGPFTTLIQEVGRDDRNFLVVEYIEKDERTFEDELVNAIAENRAPDAVILSHEDLILLRPKLQAISYDSFPTRTLRDQYLDGFEIFARANGLYAIPFAVDPIVMYWNRDILAAGGFASPPATWESLISMVERLTLRDATRNLLQATVAFGEYENVQNAKSILLTLLLQSGSQMIIEGTTRYEVKLDKAAGNETDRPLFSTLQFFVEFSNVYSPLYSWNRTFTSDQSAFLGEKLALYFGFGREATRLRQQNPNLNFDVSPVPQGAGATVKRTYGEFYGYSLIATGKNQSGAYRALLLLGNAANTAKLASELGLAPAHRMAIESGTENPVLGTIFNQALVARGWLDPNKTKSSEIFGQMIEDITSGRQQAGAVSSDTIRRLELAF